MIDLIWPIITNPDHYLKVLIDTSGLWLYLFLFLLIFLENAFIFLAFLPGSSVIFLCGSVAANQDSNLNLPILTIILVLGAYLGGLIKYYSGTLLDNHQFIQRRISPKIQSRATSVMKTNGKLAVISNDFIPLIGNFIPIFAGYHQMPFKNYNLYNFIASVIWILVFIVLGLIGSMIPILRDNITITSIGVAILLVFISASIEKSRQHHAHKIQQYK